MRCYGCGVSIKQDEPVFYREVQTGHSVHYGRRGGGSSTYYAVKPFCVNCVSLVNRKPPAESQLFENIVAVVIGGGILLLVGKCACG